jgi:CO/xanthine dehydrogenase Mo-binding subunit
MAIQKAAEDARKQILEAAGVKMEVHPDDLEIRNSTVFVKSAPGKSMSVADVVRFNRYRKDGQAVMAKSHWDAPSQLADPVTGRGNFSMAFSFGAKAIEVEVDPGTGRRFTGFGQSHQPPGGHGTDRGCRAHGTRLCHERRDRPG